MAKKNTGSITDRFYRSLATFKRATKTSMTAARACSHLALENFAKHENLSLCQQFFDAMPRNYVRRAAFAQWLMAHAPVVMDGTKFLKDKADDAVPLNMEAALGTPFWDFAPDKEEVMFASKDIYSAVERAIKRFRTAAEKKHLTEDGKRTLEEVEGAISALKDGKHLAVTNNDDNGDGTEVPQAEAA